MMKKMDELDFTNMLETAFQKTLLRESKEKPPTGRTYLQNTHPMKDSELKCTENSENSTIRKNPV